MTVAIRNTEIFNRLSHAFNDNILSEKEAKQVYNRALESEGGIEDKQLDLLSVVQSKELKDNLTKEAREFLSLKVGLKSQRERPTSNRSTNKLLNPTIQLLSEIGSFGSITSEETSRLFQFLGQYGCALSDFRTLNSIYFQYSSSWDSSVRKTWADKLDHIKVHPRTILRRPFEDVAEAEDLSSEFKTFFFQSYDSDVQKEFVADMILYAAANDCRLVLQVNADDSSTLRQIARSIERKTGLKREVLGKTVFLVTTKGHSSVWAEDNRVVLDSGKVRVPPRLSKKVFQDAQIYTADEGYHPFEPGSFQGAVSTRGESEYAKEMAEALGQEVVETVSYIEGGNLVPGTTLVDGVSTPYAIVGKDTLAITLCQIEDIGLSSTYFSKENIEIVQKEMEKRGDLNRKNVSKMAAKLIMNKRIGKSVRRWDYYRNPDRYLDSIRFSFRQRKKACQMLAKLEISKDIVANDLGIKPENLVVVDQPEFHIDMCLRPLGPGVVMVHHPSAAIALLQEILEQSSLSEKKRKVVKGMLRYAKEELQQLGSVYDRIIKQLQSAGLIVERAPGVFKEGHSGIKANFMNAVPGISPKSGTKDYIVIGSSVKPLQEGFSRYIRKFGVQNVHFVGNGVPSQGYGKTAGEISLDMMGGIDCREAGFPGEVTGGIPLSSRLPRFSLF